MGQKSAQTGPGAMGLVALEQIKFPEDRRVLVDDLAYRILPCGMRVAIRLKAGPFSGDFIVKQAERKVPGLWGSIMCRKRCIDEKVSESAQDGQIGMMVNLGAGYDTRAYRLPALTGIRVLELDQGRIVHDKRSRLCKLFGKVPTHVILVPVDFDGQDLGTVLRSHGWKDDMKTFFIWEGVTQYLTLAGVRTIFESLAEAAPGSRLVFTYIRRDFIDGKALYGHEFLFRKMVKKDRIWLFGMHPEEVAGFLDKYGWRVLEHLGYEDLAGKYVKPTGRNLQSMPIERLVYAVRTSNR